MEQYEELIMEVIEFEKGDVLITSQCYDEVNGGYGPCT